MRHFSNIANLIRERNVNWISGVFVEPFFFQNLTMDSCRESTRSGRIADFVHGGFSDADNFRSAANFRSNRSHDRMSYWHHAPSCISSAAVDIGYSGRRACGSSDDVITSGLAVSRRGHLIATPPSPFADEFESCSVDTADSWPCDSATFYARNSSSGLPAENDDEYRTAQYRKQFNSERRFLVPTAGRSDNGDENDENDNVLFVGDEPEVDQSHRRKRKCEQYQAQQRQAANQRERKRMQSINDAFEGLRAHIPILPYEKRLSKVDTLRVAIGYIGFLAELVDNEAQSGGVRGPLGSAGDGHGLNGRNSKPKIIIQYHGSVSADDCDASTLVAGHSLSWTDEKRRISQSHSSSGTARLHTMSAKIWIPEDPRQANTISSESNTALGTESLELTDSRFRRQ